MAAKDHMVAVRVTAEQHAAIMAAARARGLAMADWARMVMVDAVNAWPHSAMRARGQKGRPTDAV